MNNEVLYYLEKLLRLWDESVPTEYTNKEHERLREILSMQRIEKIKQKIDNGIKVYDGNEGYVCYKDRIGQYLSTFLPNGYTIGLTNLAGNGDKAMKPEYVVWVDTESHGYVLLSVNGRTQWKTKRIAEKHAREWKAGNMRDSWVELL